MNSRLPFECPGAKGMPMHIHKNWQITPKQKQVNWVIYFLGTIQSTFLQPLSGQDLGRLGTEHPGAVICAESHFIGFASVSMGHLMLSGCADAAYHGSQGQRGVAERAGGEGMPWWEVRVGFNLLKGHSWKGVMVTRQQAESGMRNVFFKKKFF